MSARIYIEGGGDSKELHARCREGFRRLLERCGFGGRLPRLVACGGRSAAFDDFCTAQRNTAPSEYVAMLVDSEEPAADVETPWAHLALRDGWARPQGADDEQALLMVTCMETWIVTDRMTLRRHYGSDLQESALPALDNMESRSRTSIQDALWHATRDSARAYTKGRRSFSIVGELDPEALRPHLPSFRRFMRILQGRL